MLSAIKLFLKNKVFSISGVFILIFITLIGVFIIFNSNVILSKLGFETTTTLKAELVRTQEELKTAKKINDDLNKTIENLRVTHENEIESIKEFYKEKEKARNAVLTISKKKESKNRAIIRELESKITTTEVTISIPIEEYNKLSESNIEFIHEAYDLLFKEYLR